MTTALIAPSTERACARCSGLFGVDTTVRGHWLQKFCSVECRSATQNEIRCHRAKTKTRSNRVVRGKIVLTDEQRHANELLRRQRSADGRRGQVVSQERRDKTSATLRARYAAGEISVIISEMTPERRKKISQGMIQAYREGRANLTGHYKGHWHTYEGPSGSIRMRSQSETIFATHMDSIGVRWEFEPKRFDLGWCTYTPDFYLPDFDLWIEVKGAWMGDSRKKFDEFGMTHSAMVVMAKDLLKGKFAGLSVANFAEGLISQREIVNRGRSDDRLSTEEADQKW
jgi:hypothetical protein